MNLSWNISVRFLPITCEVQIQTACERGGVGMEQRPLCSAQAIPAGSIFWSGWKEFKWPGLVCCPVWRSWQAGWDHQQDTPVLNSHRRLQGRRVPRRAEIGRMMLNEQFPVLKMRPIDSLNLQRNSIVQSYCVCSTDSTMMSSFLTRMGNQISRICIYSSTDIFTPSVLG